MSVASEAQIASGVGNKPAVRRQSLWSKALYKFRRDRTGMLAFAIVVAYSVIAVGVWLGWFAADWADVTDGKWESATGSHWFGTNIIGQDIFARAVACIDGVLEKGQTGATV